MSAYKKTITAVYTALMLWAFTALADGHVDTLEWVGLAGAAGSGLGVYYTQNR